MRRAVEEAAGMMRSVYSPFFRVLTGVCVCVCVRACVCARVHACACVRVI